MRDAEAQLRLQASISGLAVKAPTVSVRRLLSRGQRRFMIGLAVLLILGLAFSVVDTVTAIVAVVTGLYLICIVYRAYLFVRSTRAEVSEIVTDEEARAVPDADLPTYTVMIPAYREPEVINNLVASIGRLEYPVDRLQVLVLVEADDDETIDAVRDWDPGPQFSLVLVPPAEPRTKPKALNYGLTLARGELVAVYDAEDEPDPLQLRRAAVALGRLGTRGGLSCRPNFHTTIRIRTSSPNGSRSSTRCGTRSSCPDWRPLTGSRCPWAGTSNHFRRLALRSLGGWDPYNVTEDADLGIRMFREGYVHQDPRVGHPRGGQQRLRELG
jgi:cellulose synthase/poly-beta-1,6-N-acetylglucosamine synthase-like glycosyltransferase